MTNSKFKTIILTMAAASTFVIGSSAINGLNANVSANSLSYHSNNKMCNYEGDAFQWATTHAASKYEVYQYLMSQKGLSSDIAMRVVNSINDKHWLDFATSAAKSYKSSNSNATAQQIIQKMVQEHHFKYRTAIAAYRNSSIANA